MSKIGVGIGDDFPLDDGHGGGAGGSQGAGASQDTPQSERDEFEAWKRRRDARRAEREYWRSQREEWRARKREFKRRIREAARESFGDRGDWHDRYGDGHYHWRPRFWGLWLLVPVLGILLFFSLVSAVFKAPFVFLALVAIGAFFFMHHGRYRFPHDHRDFGRGDFGGRNRGPIVTPPPASPEPPASSTPPAVTNGK
jgi:hypothetical protein